MVTRGIVRLLLWLVAIHSVTAALGVVLWWSFDSGPWSSSPELVLAEQAPTSAVRVYGDHPALDPADAAARTVDRVAALGGFDRSVLVVTIPTGSGWVDPAQIAAIETWAAGDVATVAMRYSSAPSAVAFTLRPDLATDSARALLTEVTDRLRTLSPHERPRLVVHGLSLGARAGAAVLADPAVADLVDATLWQGLPGGLDSSDEAASPPCTVSVLNPDDPVAELSWDLLREPSRALGVLAALPGSDSAAPGRGHHYRAVLPPPECVPPSGGPDALLGDPA